MLTVTITRLGADSTTGLRGKFACGVEARGERPQVGILIAGLHDKSVIAPARPHGMFETARLVVAYSCRSPLMTDDPDGGADKLYA